MWLEGIESEASLVTYLRTYSLTQRLLGRWLCLVCGFDEHGFLERYRMTNVRGSMRRLVILGHPAIDNLGIHAACQNTHVCPDPI